MKMIIPDEIKRRIRNKRVARLCVFFGILAIIVVAYAFWQPIWELDFQKAVTVAVLCLLIICGITGVPFRLPGQIWAGEVLGMTVKTTIETRDPLIPKNSTWVNTNTVYLNIKTAGGRVKTKKVEGAPANHSAELLDRYKKGDYVAKFVGVLYPAHYDADKKETRCVFCGRYNPNGEHECECCHGALVKFDTCE